MTKPNQISKKISNKLKLVNSVQNWEIRDNQNEFLELKLKGKNSLNFVQKDNSKLKINLCVNFSEFDLCLLVWQIGQNCKSEIKIWGKIGAKKTVKIKIWVFHLGKNGKSLQKSAFLVEGNLDLVGKIVINTAKCQGIFENKNLILGGIVRVEPFLEIYQLPKLCQHSTTTGNLEQETLQYLNSRGLNFEQSKKLIISHFLEEFENA